MLVFVLMNSFIVSLAAAEKINIDVENNYYPGDEISLKFFLYDDNNNKIEGMIHFIIQDYHVNIFQEGDANSGEGISFILPEESIRGLWKVSASYGDVKGEAWFNIQELEKAEIFLEGSNLIVKNIGNVQYGKPISISIGEHSETALVKLGVGQTKQIRLTAPPGEYDIKVSDGTEDNTFEIRGVSLTGNVIGLENIGKFLVALGLVIVVALGLKFYDRGLK